MLNYSPATGMRSMTEGDATVTIEVTIGKNIRVVVAGKPDASLLADSLKAALQAIQHAGEALDARTISLGRRKIPEEIVKNISSFSNKELALLLLYFEGPMSKEMINQRSRELGKEIKRDWLDTELYRSMRELIISEDSPEGGKVYRLTERGKIEAEKLVEEHPITS